MEYEKIERYVSELLTLSAIDKEGKEQAVGSALYHLLLSAAIRDLMSDEEKELFRELTKKLQYFFCTRLNLKERKGKQKQENFPPNPLIKEKQTKGKEEKTNSFVGDGISALDSENEDSEKANRLKGHSVLSATLEARRAAFLEELKAFSNRYQAYLLNDFYFYWTEENPMTGKMRFEEQKHWKMENRLARWSKNAYSAANVSAAIRMKRLAKQQQKEQMVEQTRALEAKEREQAREQREAEHEAQKQKAGGLDEVIKGNPTGLLASVMREREAREAAKAKKEQKGDKP